jgi:hypothetical protein
LFKRVSQCVSTLFLWSVQPFHYSLPYFHMYFVLFQNLTDLDCSDHLHFPHKLLIFMCKLQKARCFLPVTYILYYSRNAENGT